MATRSHSHLMWVRYADAPASSAEWSVRTQTMRPTARRTNATRAYGRTLFAIRESLLLGLGAGSPPELTLQRAPPGSSRVCPGGRALRTRRAPPRDRLRP